MKRNALILILLLFSPLSISAKKDREYSTDECGSSYLGWLTAAAVGAGAAVAAPLALPALGFTSAGIAAGSVASSMMAASGAASGGGVATGSVVATLQSVGAAGVGAAGKIGLASTGATVASGVKMAYEKAKCFFGGEKGN
ncbi:LOW QUALITY PROTEIN: interferon alpha-inducible protein 27-like protein 2A [Penaeus vannamei]|uniref:LOW QUALITY PROTEIN: interferon alpha-inducible protein 27-like protein 2A n=1 Tax=Penaeus vannamei TaxID=6689 RepID=UPI00387FAAD4